MLYDSDRDDRRYRISVKPPAVTGTGWLWTVRTDDDDDLLVMRAHAPSSDRVRAISGAGRWLHRHVSLEAALWALESARHRLPDWDQTERSSEGYRLKAYIASLKRRRQYPHMTVRDVAVAAGVAEATVRAHDAELAPDRAVHGVRVYDPVSVSAWLRKRAER